MSKLTALTKTVSGCSGGEALSQTLLPVVTLQILLRVVFKSLLSQQCSKRRKVKAFWPLTQKQTHVLMQFQWKLLYVKSQEVKSFIHQIQTAFMLTNTFCCVWLWMSYGLGYNEINGVLWITSLSIYIRNQPQSYFKGKEKTFYFGYKSSQWLYTSCSVF